MIIAMSCHPGCTESAISPAIWYALEIMDTSISLNANARVVSRMTPQDYALKLRLSVMRVSAYVQILRSIHQHNGHFRNKKLY